MQTVNRRSALGMGAAALAGVVATQLSSRVASAAEPRHPRIHHAIEALRDARKAIEETSHNWGGHKTEAIGAIDNAMRHLEALEDWHE